MKERHHGADIAQWAEHVSRSDGHALRHRVALVVDDEADSREALAILLSWSGHEVYQASDGEQALTAAERYRPELIFLDIGMPELNGYDVCKRLRNSTLFKDARIIALSGFTGELHQTRCSEAGFDALLTKPLDPAELERLTAVRSS